MLQTCILSLKYFLLFLFHVFPSCADLAPYLMTCKVSQGLLNCNQTKTWLHLNTTIEEELEKKVAEEKTTITSFIDNRHMQKGNSIGHELTGNHPIQEPPLCFDLIKNCMAGTRSHTHMHTLNGQGFTAVSDFWFGCTERYWLNYNLSAVYQIKFVNTDLENPLQQSVNYI